jgi:hypothetical protein
VRRQASAQRLEETQLNGLGRRIDDWKINDNPLKEDVSHETFPYSHIQKMMRR